MGERKVVDLLLSRGANPSAAVADGTTPLHWAAYLGDEEIIGAMVDAKAQVNARGESGRTPLHLAAAFGKLAAVGKLIERGEVKPRCGGSKCRGWRS